MQIYHSYNKYHLGDNLWHLQFLRGLAKQHPEVCFIHAMNASYLPQLADVVCDLPNIAFRDVRCRWPGSINAWINADNAYESDPQHLDVVPFLIRHFRRLASRMGFESPIRSPADFFYDYPAILRYRDALLALPTVEADTDAKNRKFCRKRCGNCTFRLPFDVLLMNSKPLSGQYSIFDPKDFSVLTMMLVRRGLSVISTSPVSVPGVPCTQNMGLSLTGIGALSIFCRCIIGILNGPMWPTFNVWNHANGKTRIVFLNNGEKFFLEPDIIHVKNMSEAFEVLQMKGIL